MSHRQPIFGTTTIMARKRQRKGNDQCIGATQLLSASLILATCLLAVLILPKATFAQSNQPVDTTNRQAVVNLYNTQYNVPAVDPGWTGNVASCIPGTTTPAFQASVLQRINYFRSMAGVPPTAGLNTEASRKAQAAALMMAAKGMLSHYPSIDWPCYTQDGKDGAASSNLHFGSSGPAAIDGYMNDGGFGNNLVGHRRGILLPQRTAFGTGDIPSRTNALFLADGHAAGNRPATRDDFVAWPPKGYVPYMNVFGRWSFSYPKANFTNATITMINKATNLPVQAIEHRDADNTWLESAIVWIPAGYSDGSVWAKPVCDTTYQVTIGNVIINGEARTFTYDVTIIDPAVAPCNTGDLAVRIQPAAGQSTTVTPGADVNFTVDIFNQGQSTINTLTLINHLPTHWTLSPNDNNGWNGTRTNSFRYVRLVAEAPANAHVEYESAGIAEIGILDADGNAINRTGWQATASNQAFVRPAQFAIDGLPQTYWEVEWWRTSYPYTFDIDLGTAHSIGGFTYHQAGCQYSWCWIKDFSLYVSNDGQNWGEAVFQGELANVADQQPETKQFILLNTVTAPTLTLNQQIAPGTAVAKSFVARAGTVSGPATDVVEVLNFEIAGANAGRPTVDVDSTMDTLANNDTVVDNVIDNSNGDEDDQDIAAITISEAVAVNRTITFIKAVVGGSAQPGAFSFHVTGGPQNIAHNGTASLATGTYIVTEQGTTGYDLSAASGACALTNGQIILTVADSDATCTVTNTAQASSPIGDTRWTGAQSTDWSDGRNWLTGQAPGPGSNVIIPGDLTNYPIIADSTTAQVHNLFIQESSTADSTKDGKLTMTGGELTVTGNWNQEGTAPTGYGYYKGFEGLPTQLRPNIGPEPVIDTIDVPASTDFEIDDIDVSLAIDHTWIGDLVVKLKHETTGKEIILLDPRDGCSGDNLSITLDDQAGDEIADKCTNNAPAYPDGSYRPVQALSTFNGETPVGTWKLTIEDRADGDVGTLVRWGILFRHKSDNGSFTATGGKVIFAKPSGAQAIYAYDDQFHHVQFGSQDGTATATINGTLDVNGDLEIVCCGSVTGGRIALAGNFKQHSFSSDRGLVGDTGFKFDGQVQTVDTVNKSTDPNALDLSFPSVSLNDGTTVDIGHNRMNVASGLGLGENSSIRLTRNVPANGTVRFAVDENTHVGGEVTITAGATALGETTVTMTRKTAGCTTRAGESIQLCYTITPATPSAGAAFIRFKYAGIYLNGNDCLQSSAYLGDSTGATLTPLTRAAVSCTPLIITDLFIRLLNVEMTVRDVPNFTNQLVVIGDNIGNPGGRSNADPIATADIVATAVETPIVVDAIANDFDPQGDSIRIDFVGQPAHGSVEITSKGYLLYTPAAGYEGTDSFTYELWDALDNTATGTVTVTVGEPDVTQQEIVFLPLVQK